MFNSYLYKFGQPYPWGPNWPRQWGITICQRLMWRNLLLWNHKVCVSSMLQCLVVPYINPADLKVIIIMEKMVCTIIHVKTIWNVFHVLLSHRWAIVTFWATCIVCLFEPWHEISNNVVCATSKASDQPAHMRSLIRAFTSRLNILWVLSYWLNII